MLETVVLPAYILAGAEAPDPVGRERDLRQAPPGEHHAVLREAEVAVVKAIGPARGREVLGVDRDHMQEEWGGG